MADRELARITITRFINDDGQDLVNADSDDLTGGRVAVVEALGMLALADYDITHYEDDDT